jgi:hypothetical protein
MGYVRMNSRVYAEGRPAADRQRSISGQNFVDAAYFATMGMALADGRAFSDQDRAESRPVAIVNVRLATSLWPGERAIGKRLSTTGPDGPWAEVVGVANTGKYHLLFENPQPHVYFPIAQRYSEFRTLHVKTSLEPEALAPSVLRALQTREPDLQVFDVQSMNRALGSGYGLFVTRVAAASGATFAALALALALVGLHGLLAYRTNLRVVELGIRMALGARRSTVLWLITRDGLRLLAWGAALGAPAALACSRLLASQVPGVTAWDALWVVPAAASLVATGAVAVLVPALRASRTSPVEALRCE